MSEQPEVVEKFLAITARGFLAVAKEPQLAASVYEKTIPYFPQYLIEASLPKIATSWTRDGKWGEQYDDVMQEYSDWLYDNGILNQKDGWKSSYTNKYLPKERVLI